MSVKGDLVTFPFSAQPAVYIALHRLAIHAMACFCFRGSEASLLQTRIFVSTKTLIRTIQNQTGLKIKIITKVLTVMKLEISPLLWTR